MLNFDIEVVFKYESIKYMIVRNKFVMVFDFIVLDISFFLFVIFIFFKVIVIIILKLSVVMVFMVLYFFINFLSKGKCI